MPGDGAERAADVRSLAHSTEWCTLIEQVLTNDNIIYIAITRR